MQDENNIPVVPSKKKKRSRADRDLTAIKIETKFQGLHIRAQTKILTEVCRDMKAHRKDFKQHSDEDATKFAEHGKKITKLETNQTWIIRAGTFMFGIFGITKIFGK